MEHTSLGKVVLHLINSYKQNARIEHYKAFLRVMTALLSNDTDCSSSSATTTVSGSG